MSKAHGKSREEIIQSLTERIDKFEKYTTPHSQSMAALASLLAKRFGLSQSEVAAIAEAARLHDIGLYAMSPIYHSAAGDLRFEDRLDLWRHSIIGEQEMAKREFSRHAQLLVRWHHEWWNGTGYPDMLAFEDIPIGARILRAVELYNALTSARPYRTALHPEEALDTLAASAGVECDPYVVAALIALLDEMYPAAAGSLNAIADAATPEPTIAEPSQAGVSAMPFSDSGSPAAPPDRLPAEPHRPHADPPAFDAAPAPSTAVWSPIAAPPRPSPEPGAAEDRPAGEERPLLSPLPAASPAPPSDELLEPILKRRLPPSPLSTTPLVPERTQDLAVDESPSWRGWKASSDNTKSLLAFEASVLRQIPFETIAITYTGEAKLDWYLKVWGKRILTNDTRAWSTALARALVESREVISEEGIQQLLRDIYVPGNRLINPSLRRWFTEMDAWWMDNLRRNIAALEDETWRAQALLLGMQTGDYALSFTDATIELRRPLATVFWRLARRFSMGNQAHPANRVFHLAPQHFIEQATADLLYLNLPASKEEKTGTHARSEWRECWVTGEEGEALPASPQSKQAYLAHVDRLLRVAAHIRKWAIGCQEIGLTSAREIAELVKEHRPVRATYSKDVTEVAGGLRSYIIVAEL